MAMALNGGVSLAVWMGGCAVEIDCARRAHLGNESVDQPTSPSFTKGEIVRKLVHDPWAPEGSSGRRPSIPAPERTVYAALCGGFQRELVVDIMSGASAGGINGALLSAAIRFKRRLHPDFVRSRWLDLGDFSGLLHPLKEPHPKALMQGQEFYRELLGVFSSLLGKPGSQDSRLTELPNEHHDLRPLDAKLDVTTTNVAGEERAFTDHWGENLYAREYRSRFRFRIDDDFTAENLASAARASASFPVAFEPYLIADNAQRKLAGLTQPRWVIDGGLLDNAPIAPAIELIPSRSAAREVKRFVCYVNADPPERPATDVASSDTPPVRDVLGYLVSLPRKAPFVDQVNAIEAAGRRGDLVSDLNQRLLALDLDNLVSVARGLLPVYAETRIRLALQELIGEVPAAEEARARFEDPGAESPFGPLALDTPITSDSWRWGLRAGERVLYLLADLLRDQINTEERPDAKTTLLEARRDLFTQITSIEQRRLRIQGKVDADLDDQLTALAGENAFTFQRVRAGAEVVFGPDVELGKLPDGRDLRGVLLGPCGQFSDQSFDRFLHRALAIEVVRRTFAPEEDLHTAQKLNFAQLTPFAPCPIFTPTPFQHKGPASPKAKLTGIHLSHFSGFYRRAWRANDFMWGRLDAAARLVQILVDPQRAGDGSPDGSKPHVWERIADSLLPQDCTRVQFALLREAIRDAPNANPKLPPAVIAELAEASEMMDQEFGMAGEESSAGDASQLKPTLEKALKADLSAPDGGRFTTVVCIRAVQLEIVHQELPHLARESHDDMSKGTLIKELPFRENDGVWDQIEKIRGEESSLPEQLGRDTREELSSNLALRTIIHAVFVGLAVLREGKVPAAQLLNVIRAPLFGVAGLVARSPWYKAVTALGFVAASFFLTGRVVATDPSAVGGPDVRYLAAVVAAIALLFVAGIAVVPAWRGWYRRGWRRLLEWGFAAVLVVTGGALAGVLALRYGDLSLGQLLRAPGAEIPSTAVLLLAISVVLGVPFARLALPRVGKVINDTLRRPFGGPLALGICASVAGFLIATTATSIWDATDFHHMDWKFWAAIGAWLSILVAPLYVFVGIRSRSSPIQSTYER